MEASDYGTFERAFQRVSGAFRLKLKAPEQDDLARTYFRVLEGYPLDRVLDAGKQAIQQQARFPKPAEWFALVSRQGVVNGPADVRQLTQDEAAAQARAVALRYRDAPCDCPDCQAHAVTTLALRYVPNELHGALERAFNPRRGGVDVVGHWAHGAELRAWYAARARFFALTFPKYPQLARRLVPVEREPGEEG